MEARAHERLLEIGLDANELPWQAAAHANLGIDKMNNGNLSQNSIPRLKGLKIFENQVH